MPNETSLSPYTIAIQSNPRSGFFKDCKKIFSFYGNTLATLFVTPCQSTPYILSLIRIIKNPASNGNTLATLCSLPTQKPHNEPPYIYRIAATCPAVAGLSYYRIQIHPLLIKMTILLENYLYHVANFMFC